MLDQPDMIARYDKSDALGVITGLPNQLSHDFLVPEGLAEMRGISSIVLTGMGGSAQGAEFVKTWLSDRLSVPLVIVRDYALPAFVGPDTLVIAASYSGNTEETLTAIKDASAKKARIVVIAAGGKLLETAKTMDYPYFVLPGGLQPRFAVLYAVRALVTVIETLGLVSGVLDELAAAGKWLDGQLGAWAPDVPTTDNAAKRIAESLVGHVAVVYAGPTLAFAAMKWKIAFNENSKNIAFYNYFPEMDHNEFIGWQFPKASGIKVIELRSDLDSTQEIDRFDITNRLLSASFAPIEVHAVGDTKLRQLVWTIGLGEHVACYLAFLNGIDPTPVLLVEKLKTELAQHRLR